MDMIFDTAVPFKNYFTSILRKDTQTTVSIETKLKKFTVIIFTFEYLVVHNRNEICM